MLWRERKVEAAYRSCVEPGSCFPRDLCGMIVEDQFDRGAGRIGGIEKLEEFDELAAAVAISDERVDLSGKQIDPGQQAERAMAFVLMIPRKGGVDAGLGRQIRRRRRDNLNFRLLVARDDRHRFSPLLGSGRGFFQDIDFAIDAQNLRHLLFKRGVAIFKIVAHLVRLDCLLAEKLAHRALNQTGETFVLRRRSVLTCMTGQKPRRSQLVWIAVLVGLLARQRHQLSLGLRRDHRLLARSRSAVECRQCAVRHASLDAALARLMVHAKPLSHGKERWLFKVGEQHRCPRHPAPSSTAKEPSTLQPPDRSAPTRPLAATSP